MEGTLKKILVVGLGAVIGLGGFSALSRTFKDDEEKSKLTFFEEFDNSDEWTEKKVAEVSNFENSVIRFYLPNEDPTVTFSLIESSFRVSLSESDVGFFHGNIGVELSVPKNTYETRIIEEVGTVTIGDNTYEYTSYYDLHILAAETTFTYSGGEMFVDWSDVTASISPISCISVFVFGG